MTFEITAACDRCGHPDAVWIGRPATLSAPESGTVYTRVDCPACDWTLAAQLQRAFERRAA